MQLRCLGLPLPSFVVYVFIQHIGWLYTVQEQRAGVTDLQWDPSSATLAAGWGTAQKCGMKSHTDAHALKARLQLSCNIFF